MMLFEIITFKPVPSEPIMCAYCQYLFYSNLIVFYSRYFLNKHIF